MRLIDKFIIKADKNKNTKKKLGDLEIIIDNHFNPYDETHVTQDGEIVSVPAKYEDDRIKAGDTVYCHHHLCHKENEIEYEGEKYYHLPMDLVYCFKRDGKIEMLRDYILIEPMLEDESKFKTTSGIYITYQTPQELDMGVLAYVNEDTKKLGLDKGDVVCWEEHSDYAIYIDGAKYFRMRNRDLLAKVDGKCEIKIKSK